MRIARWCVVEPRLEFRQNLNSFLALKRCSSLLTASPFKRDMGFHRRSPILANPPIITSPSILSDSPFRYMETIRELPSINS